MHAVYRTLVPVARALVAARVSANTVSYLALGLAVLAAVAFGDGRFGVGAALACAASLADAIDGLVAREGGTQSRFGQVLDTTIDRYVDALFLGGLAVHVRHGVVPLLVVLAAIVGSFMVSYASSLERELGQAGKPKGQATPMRRAHRLAYLLTGAALGPFALRFAGEGRPYAEAFPMLVAASVIAVFGNVSAVRRALAAARVSDPAPPQETKTPTTQVPESAHR